MTQLEIRFVLEASLACRPRCSDPRFKETDWSCIMVPPPVVLLESQTFYRFLTDQEMWRQEIRLNGFHNGGMAIRLQEEEKIHVLKSYHVALQDMWSRRTYPVHRPMDCVLVPCEYPNADDFKVVYSPLP